MEGNPPLSAKLTSSDQQNEPRKRHQPYTPLTEDSAPLFIVNQNGPLPLSDQTYFDKIKSHDAGLGQVEHKHVSSALPFAEPTATDEDDVEMMDASEMPGAANDDQTTAIYEETCARMVTLKSQFPVHTQMLEVAEHYARERTGPLQELFPSALPLIFYLMKEEMRAMDIRKDGLENTLARLKQQKVQMAHVEATSQQIAEMENLLKIASETCDWALEMWKTWGDDRSLEKVAYDESCE